MTKTYQVKCNDRWHNIEEDSVIYAIDSLANTMLKESSMMLQDSVEMFCNGRKYEVIFEDGLVRSIYCNY